MEQNEQENGKKTRRHFDEQFKTDAVKLLRESGRPVAQVAKELGIDRSELKRWQKQLEVPSPLAQNVQAHPGHFVLITGSTNPEFNLSSDSHDLNPARGSDGIRSVRVPNILPRYLSKRHIAYS